MIWFVGGCILAWLLVAAGAEENRDYEDEMEEREKRSWIDYLADQNRKGHRTARNRYIVSGWKPQRK